MRPIESDKSSFGDLEHKSVPWQESLNNLDQNQIVIAEIASFTNLLRIFNKDALDQLPWLCSRAEKTINKSDIIARHVLTLIDCNDVLEAGSNIHDSMLPLLGSDVYYYGNRLKALSIQLQKVKNNIYTQARSWNQYDAKRVIEEAHTCALSLPREERLLLYDRTSLEPEKIGESTTRYIKKAKNYALTTAISASTSGIMQGVGVTAAVAGAAINPLNGVTPQVAHAALGLSFSIWLACAYENAGESWNAVRKTGIGTKIGAKLAYDIARYFNTSEAVEKGATVAGFIAPSAVNRAVYLAGAFYLSDTISQAVGTSTQNSEVSAVTASNIAMGVVHLIIAEATRRGVAIKTNSE